MTFLSCLNFLSFSVQALLPFNIIYEFPKPTWVENLVVRQRDGSILCSLLSSPDLYLVNPDNATKAIHVTTIPGVLGLLGIVELGLDVFYVAAGNYSLQEFVNTPGSYSVWEVDMRERAPQQAKTTKIASIPASGFLNGMTVLNPTEGLILIADSGLSVVWSLNVRTGRTALAINDTTMAPVKGLGINGLHVRGNELFYSTASQNTLNKIPVNLTTGKAAGPAVTLVNNATLAGPDDFCFDFDGNAWVASGTLNAVELLPKAAYGNADSVQVDVAAGGGHASRILGPTSTQFGIRAKDIKRGSLYVSSNGGVPQWMGKNWTMGGAISRIDTASLEM